MAGLELTSPFLYIDITSRLQVENPIINLNTPVAAPIYVFQLYINAKHIQIVVNNNSICTNTPTTRDSQPPLALNTPMDGPSPDNQIS